MKNNYIAAISLVGILTSTLLSEETVSKKTLAIIYEEGKTPEALFHQSLWHFKKAVETGELKSAELGTAKVFGEVIDIQTPTDENGIVQYERDAVITAVKKSTQSANIPYTSRFTILSTNIVFGDKSLGFAVNPYKGCYQHNFLAKGIEQSGFTIVDATENPDITMTIGIDACMSENEYKEYIQKNTALKINTVNTANSSNNSHIGNDLIRSGSTAQLGAPNGSGNAGLAVAGVGIALNMVSWLSEKSALERDVIRYHVKFEGKNKTPFEFYPFILTNNTHKKGSPIELSSYKEPETILFSSFIAWNALGRSFTDQLPAVLLEKNIIKATEMIVASKNNKIKEINQ